MNVLYRRLSNSDLQQIAQKKHIIKGENGNYYQLSNTKQILLILKPNILKIMIERCQNRHAEIIGTYEDKNKIFVLLDCFNKKNYESIKALCKIKKIKRMTDINFGLRLKDLLIKSSYKRAVK